MTDKQLLTLSSARPSVDSLDHFAAHGWVCVRNLLLPSELRVLQTECSALYSGQSAETIAAQGCVLDVLAQCPIRESDRARVDSTCYLKARARATNRFGEDDERVFASLMFEKLPTIAGLMLAAHNECDAATSVFFFNEHYVVKPPKSHVEFRWHRDDDEQLAMCVHRDSIQVYVSAWCALDIVTRVNGALQFVSLEMSTETTNEGTSAGRQRQASAPVDVEAGDVLFFLSNVWHYSSSNESDSARRAFYAQYSREVITSTPNDASPLSFAIPCKAASSMAAVSMSAGDSGSVRIKTPE